MVVSRWRKLRILRPIADRRLCNILHPERAHLVKIHFHETRHERCGLIGPEEVEESRVHALLALHDVPFGEWWTFLLCSGYSVLDELVEFDGVLDVGVEEDLGRPGEFAAGD